MDPHIPSKDPMRGRDPKLVAKSAQERLTYTHFLFFGPKKTPPYLFCPFSAADRYFLGATVQPEISNFANGPLKHLEGTHLEL